MSATVPTIVSNQSALAQTTSKTLSYTPTVAGIYRLSAYAIITNTVGTSWSIKFNWQDDSQAWSWGPNDGPGVTGKTAAPKSVLVRSVANQPISLVYTVTSGTPSADLYLVVEDMN